MLGMKSFYHSLSSVVLVLLACALCAICWDIRPASAAQLDNWVWRNPLPQGNSLNSIAYGNGIYVAVGSGGTILTSADGVTWTSRTSGTIEDLYGVTYGNGLFVAVGYYSSGLPESNIEPPSAILSSSDGVTWTTNSFTSTTLYSSVTYGNGKFVAVGQHMGDSTAGYMTSSDGITWSEYDMGPSLPLTSVTYGNGVFVAVGYEGYMYTSSDGVTWSRSYATNIDLHGVTYGNGVFVAVGRGGTVLTSTDGVTFRTLGAGSNDLAAVTYGNGTFVALAYTGQTLTSPDGVTWTSRSSGTTNALYGGVYGNGMYVVVGSGGTILTSTDGITWTSRTSGTTTTVSCVAYGNGMYVAVGSGGTILTSADGITWTSRTSGTTNALYGGVYGNGMYVVVGSGGTILTSADGITWTSRTSGTTSTLSGVAYGNDAFVAMGSAGSTLTSTDGVTWILGSTGTSHFIYAITYGNGTFVAVGRGGILTSIDGATWTSRTPGPSHILYGITYGNGMFVAVGQAGTILTSIDGTTWQQSISGTPRLYIYGITYGNGMFVAVGGDGYFLTSTDGVTWSIVSSGTANILRGVIYSQGHFIAVGDAGTILQSPCFFSLNSTYILVAPNGGGKIVNFIAADIGCAWTAVSNVPWINITSGSSGTGNVAVQYSVASNTGGVRTGTITIAGQTLTVMQGTTLTQAQMGVFRAGAWYVDRDETLGWGGCGPDGCYSFGMAGDQAVTGDWDGTGIVRIGVFRNGNWYLDSNGDGQWSGCGTTPSSDRCYSFGQAGDIPVVGDWNGNGVSKIGVFRNGMWYLDYPGTGSWVGCGAPADPTKDACISYGMTGDIPIVGDWNGNGVSKIGVFRNGMWYLDYPGTASWVGCGAPGDPTKDVCISYGMTGDIPIVGDWNGNATTKIGVFRYGNWYLDYTGTGSWVGCGAPSNGVKDVCAPFGMSGDMPVVFR